MEFRVRVMSLSGAGVRSFTVVLAGILSLTPCANAADVAHLAETLHKLDAASVKFLSAEADVHKDLYERVVKETTTQTGSIYFVRKGAVTQMGAKILPPSAKV